MHHYNFLKHVAFTIRTQRIHCNKIFLNCLKRSFNENVCLLKLNVLFFPQLDVKNCWLKFTSPTRDDAALCVSKMTFRDIRWTVLVNQYSYYHVAMCSNCLRYTCAWTNSLMERTHPPQQKWQFPTRNMQHTVCIVEYH